MTDRSQRADVPFRLNFEQQKNRAKDLHRALLAGDASALARYRAARSKADTAHDPVRNPPSLADAQWVIARELGLPSWPKLKAHIQAMEQARAAMAAKGGALDGALRTLHIRCGSDIGKRLAESGLTGDFLEYSDPFCQGPVIDAPDRIALRARFLTDAYGPVMGFSREEMAEKLQRAEAGLEAARRYERVVLWLEHDSYDQLMLVRCLAQFATAGAPPVLELISIDHFPGGARFIGLGQLPPEALRLLWSRRQPVTPEQLELGQQAWAALTSPDPTALATIARTGTPQLPHLAPALRRHLQELPSVRDGLSLTERLCLEILAEGDRTIGRMFSILMREREPLPWLGDVMFLAIIEAMRKVTEPAFTVPPDSEADAWPHRLLSITRTGRAVLAGERDWLSLGPPQRWVGGVPIRPGAPCWRWDMARQQPVLA